MSQAVLAGLAGSMLGQRAVEACWSDRGGATARFAVRFHPDGRETDRGGLGGAERQARGFSGGEVPGVAG
jgi:hypothetical protein